MLQVGRKKVLLLVKLKIQFLGLFVVSKIKNTVSWTYVVSVLNGEEITRSFYKKELQRTSPEKLRIEKVLEIKGDKLFVKWTGYDNRFNSWIDNKDLI